MDKTFSSMSKYNTGFNDLANCRVMRRVLKMVNGGICYDYKPYTYVFFLALLAGKFDFQN